MADPANIKNEPFLKCSALASDDSLKRNDSCSKFGQMEFVSLGIPESHSPLPQDAMNLSSCDPMKSGPDVHCKHTSNCNCSVERTEIISDCAMNESASNADATLSQYFKPDVHSSITELSASCNEDLNINGLGRGEGFSGSGKSFDGCVKENDKSANEQLSLSKFFEEDKSGHDTNGKAFFDKIAAVSTGNSSVNCNYQHTINKCPGNGQMNVDPVVVKDSTVTSFLESVTADNVMYEAWIPSEATRQILLSFVTSVPGTFYPHKDMLTRPSVIIEEEMDDPLKLLLTEINSPVAQQRKVLTANDVLQNEDGLKELIEADCYHAAINLTTRLIKSGYGLEQAHLSPQLLQIWFTRIALFVKLGKFSYAEVEAEAFGNLDKPDLYYEFYPDIYCGKKGTMVPFSFRLLLAELPQYQGNHQVALNNLYSLLNVIQKIIQNLENGFAEDGSMLQLPDSRVKASQKLWKSREIKVFYSVLNCVLSQKDYVMAVSVTHILMDKDKEHIVQLYSALGKIYLQLGDLKQAHNFFSLASEQSKNDPDKSLELEQLINSALLAVAHNDNEEAYKLYERGLRIQPNNPMLANNMAVCLLYMGRLKESLSLLEKTIQNNPKSCLHEGILFNICTLYELESSHCTFKKHSMLNLVSKYAGDNLNASCLKIPSSSKV